MIKIVFFGTNHFAATILEGLLSSPLVSVNLVITQPDKPVGRKQEMRKSAVKIMAEEKNLLISQPSTLKNYKLEIDSAQIGLVAQYGQIIPENILASFPYGAINVHPSLLPKYRGAAPIQTAILNGQTETAITLMKVDQGLDTGPILLQKICQIGQNEMYIQIEKKLAELAIAALFQAIPDYLDGKLLPVAQNEKHATLTRQLTRSDGRIDWHKTAADIYNQYRALSPWPGVWTSWNGKRLKFLQILPSEKSSLPGLVSFSVSDGSVYIGCAKGSIQVIELQIEGKKASSIKTFLNGHKTILHASLI